MNTPSRKAKRNSKKSNTKKIDAFAQAINEMAVLIGFDTTEILESFRDDKIRSSDFSLDGFKTRKEFVSEYCKNEKQLNLAKGKLIKFYTALDAKYRITGFLCHRIAAVPNLFNSGSLVFISPKYTQQIIHDKIICSAESKTLDDSKRLYQYLNWTIRVNKINKYVHCFSTYKEKNIQFLLINAELHDRNNNVLYMFCIENDIKSEKAQKWQFVKLMAFAEIRELVPDRALEQIISPFMDEQDSVCSVDVNKISCTISQYLGEYVDRKVLPLGARADGKQFKQLNANRMMSKRDILYPHDNISYLQLKGIQTGHDKNKKGNRKLRKEVLKISLHEFEDCIQTAAESRLPEHDLFPIVSILSGKKYGEGNYSVDQVLPVRIRDHWVGICYRNGKPVMELFDGYDITNKAILCEPTFDKDRLSFFTNNIYKIEILPRDQAYVPPESPSVSAESPELTPISDPLDFDTTPLGLNDDALSAEQEEDVWMQPKEQPDHDQESECPSCASTPQPQTYPDEEQERKYNYVNEACNNNNNNNHIAVSAMNIPTSPLSINGNGEGMDNATVRNTNTNNNNTIHIQSTPISMDGSNTNSNMLNTNTNTPIGTNAAINLAYIQNMNPINGQYQFKSNGKNQPQAQQQQLYNQQIYINNINYMSNIPMQTIHDLQLQTALNVLNMSTTKPSEGFQTTAFQPLNIPPHPLTFTVLPPIYCHVYTPTVQLPQMSVPMIPATSMSVPLMQQTPMMPNQQAIQQLNFQMSMPQMMQQTNNCVTSNILKATTPEFIPMKTQNRSSSIPKLASIVPTVSTIKEEK